MAVGNCNTPEPRRNTDLIDYFFNSGMGWGRAGAVRKNAENAAINRRFPTASTSAPRFGRRKRADSCPGCSGSPFLMWFVSNYK